MICPECGSDDIAVQRIASAYPQQGQKKHGCLWWLLIGWWWVIYKWTVFLVPVLIFRAIKGKKQKSNGFAASYSERFVCQDCGCSWDEYEYDSDSEEW